MTGTLKDAVAGADVFIGVSAPNVLTGDDIATMNDDAIVFALANPDPEVDPAEAAQHAAVVATGRSDFANQINNVLVFPGVFRGLLDAATNTVDRRRDAGGGEGAVGGRLRGRAEPRLHHPQRLQPGRGQGGRRRGRGGGTLGRPGPAATVAADAARSHTGAEAGSEAAPGLPSAVPPVAVPTAGPHGG